MQHCGCAGARDHSFQFDPRCYVHHICTDVINLNVSLRLIVKLKADACLIIMFTVIVFIVHRNLLYVCFKKFCAKDFRAKNFQKLTALLKYLDLQNFSCKKFLFDAFI